MIRKSGRLLGLASIAVLAAGGGGGPEGDGRASHGVFTGEIKPVIYVSDVEASAPFYRDALGFGFQGYANLKGQPYYAEMICAGVKFGLHEPVSEGQEESVGRQRLYFRVKNLAAHRARVAAWDGNPGEIRTTSWMDMFTVLDRDGNEIVFAATDPGRHTSDPWRASDDDAEDR
jgi:predicted enzyme related to lactoylglutathione lyase